jgi:phosphoribosylanthranilate isomerase
MIFFKSSPRNISFEKAKKLIANTPETLTPVAVLVDPSIEFIKKLLDLGVRDIQLHGSETVAFCKKIKKEFGVNLYKAINLKNNEDLQLADKYRLVSDWILFDYKDENFLGGTGKSFNWEILRDKNLKYNWILSGGLDYNNIINAIKITGARAIDVSSGVEKEKGVKSSELIKNFCNVVKNIR